MHRKCTEAVPLPIHRSPHPPSFRTVEPGEEWASIADDELQHFYPFPPCDSCSFRPMDREMGVGA